MTVSGRAGKSMVKRNEWAESSSWLSICSVLPYLIFGFMYLLETKVKEHFYEPEFVLVLFCLFWGILLGSISLITGMVSIRQIKRSQDTETGAHLAIFGMVLGSIAIILNILFAYGLFMLFMRTFMD